MKDLTVDEVEKSHYKGGKKSEPHDYHFLKNKNAFNKRTNSGWA